jgi:hypothetical protein
MLFHMYSAPPKHSRNWNTPLKCSKYYVIFLLTQRRLLPTTDHLATCRKEPILYERICRHYSCAIFSVTQLLASSRGWRNMGNLNEARSTCLRGIPGEVLRLFSAEDERFLQTRLLNNWRRKMHKRKLQKWYLEYDTRVFSREQAMWYRASP